MSVLSHLQATASGLILSTSESTSIATSISTLNSSANQYFAADLKSHVQFGSSTRGTQLPRKVDGRSDVDYMFVFDNTDSLKPQTLLDRIRRFVESKYQKSEVHQSHPTVLLLLSHMRFELVPAYKSWWGQLQIPAPASNFEDWIGTNPTGFNTELQEANWVNDYNLLPLIRLMKYWNAQNGYVFESYSLEQKLATASFWFCTSFKEYLYSAVESLGVGFFAPQWKQDRIERAKRIVAKTKQLEREGIRYLPRPKSKSSYQASSTLGLILHTIGVTDAPPCNCRRSRSGNYAVR